MADSDITLPTDAVVVVESFPQPTLTLGVTPNDAVAVLDSVEGKLLSLAIANARALNSNEVRIDFTKNVVVDAALLDPSNYVITPISAGAVPVVASAVEAPTGQPTPSFITLTVNEMTDSAVYQVQAQGDIQSVDGSLVDNVPSAFAGVGEPPDLFLILAVDKNTVQVQFTEAMEDNSAIRDLNNYSFDLGLAITAITDVDGSTVHLTTGDQIEGQLYILTVRGILAAVINDKIVVTEQVVPPAAEPPNAMTQDAVLMTEGGVFMTETP